VIELPYPSPLLWPNARGHFMAKHRQTAKARLDAFMLMNGYLDGNRQFSAPVRICYTVHPKTKRAPDLDNCVAAMKAYQDGICGALKIDDATLDTPRIIIGEPVKGGKVIAVVEY
jgi:crossover junction endodeoxyribonuclease RusA